MTWADDGCGLARRRLLLGAAALVCSSGLSGCGEAAPVYTYRYRLTLEVEADGKVYTGSSVIARAVGQTSKWLLNQTSMVRDNTVGEATLVDLGDGRVLVALLNGINVKNVSMGRDVQPEYPWWGAADGVIARRLGIKTTWIGTSSPGMHQLVRSQGRWTLAQNELPLLLTFRNVADPTSYELVDPNRVSAMLGTDVTRVTGILEITNDPVTRTLVTKLPWLPAVGNLVNGTTNAARFKCFRQPCISSDDFVRN